MMLPSIPYHQAVNNTEKDEEATLLHVNPKQIISHFNWILQIEEKQDQDYKELIHNDK